MNYAGVYFVYDGDCPLCNSAAQALRIKKTYGILHLINARQDMNHPLMREIHQRKLNLDEGMVIYASGQFYHGKEALKFMAKFGQARNALMVICKGFFWSDTLSSVSYPWMKAIRNWILRRRNIAQLDNLSVNKIEGDEKS